MVRTVLLALPAVTCLVQAGVLTPAVTGNAEAEKHSCRSTYATGTIMSARVCHTRTEWASIDAANQQKIDNRRNSNTQ